MSNSDLTPLFELMLHEMRQHLSDSDVRAGLPEAQTSEVHDISVVYAHWEKLTGDVGKQQELLAELEQDIARMEPWGEFPMDRIAQLALQGQSLRFWAAPVEVTERQGAFWADAYQATPVATRDGITYFTTTTPGEVLPVLQGADEVHVVPSPLSTLIMLQTRAKDRLRRLELQQADFALAHYREVEHALGVSDTLQPVRHRILHHIRHRLLPRIKRIFHS